MKQSDLGFFFFFLRRGKRTLKSFYQDLLGLKKIPNLKTLDVLCEWKSSVEHEVIVFFFFVLFFAAHGAKMMKVYIYIYHVYEMKKNMHCKSIEKKYMIEIINFLQLISITKKIKEGINLPFRIVGFARMICYHKANNN